MKSIKELKDLDPADCIIKWRLTEMCNINCSYCIRGWRTDRSVDKEKLTIQEDRLCDVMEHISNLLNNTNFHNVKIDLIGGEVTIFNLQRILSHIRTDKITKIQVTTNMMRDIDYYIRLADLLQSKNINLSITASFHYEFQSIDKYFEKVIALKDKVSILTCEMVSNIKNQNLCKQFSEKCKLENLYYMIEADLREKSFNDRKNGLFIDSNKPFNNSRYEVTFTDGTKKKYKTRNMLLTDESVEENYKLKYIRTSGYLCTNSTNFFYLDFDIVHGRTEKSDSCSNCMPIEDFKFLPPKRCPVDYCTLCGHMSLRRD